MIKYCSLILLVLIGCTPASKLRRAERLINSAIESGAKVSRDTVYIDRTVYIPKHVLDSNVYFKNIYDTITVEKDKVITKIKYSKDKHTVYVHTECPDSTITIKVPVEVVREIKAGITWWDVVKICILVAGVSILLTIFVLSKRKG